MNELEEGKEGYARFTPSGNKIGNGITAWIKITKVNGEYLEIEDDEFKYKVRKDKFLFVKTIL